ncbi:YbaB/EbfC family nucleoid-associated protein [Gandjariella thermophila]|uniref:Uncharacterized protein n=1 Tax=Gandjariella thermophila TaxID=1931992 RepID=A0A4D4J4B4_9PSEU|nr:YbaB/EbfC family nucleoid-associated protein [Gandjariella thermophila]GDY29356.1 hypothetical protein GTS_09890 [Gandjariella thermophila]
MTEPVTEQVERLRHRLEAVRRNQRDAEERFARLDAMRAEVAAIETAVTSSDRAVTVVAGPGGSVKSVRFADEARRLTPNQLSQTVTATIQRAVAEAAKQQATVVQSYVGDDIDVLGRVMKTQEELLGHALRPAETEAPTGVPGHRASSPAPPPSHHRPGTQPRGRLGWGPAAAPGQRPGHAPPPPAGSAAAPAVPPGGARPAPRRPAVAPSHDDPEQFSVFDRGTRPTQPPAAPGTSRNSDGVMRLYDEENG